MPSYDVASTIHQSVHFEDLCGARGRLGAADYLALADRFDAIAVAGIPTFSTHNENEARRFINLVDVLYERRALLLGRGGVENKHPTDVEYPPPPQTLDRH